MPPFQVAPFHLEGRQDRKGAERVAVALQKLQHMEEEEEERGLIIDLKRHARLAVAWSRHGSPVPRWT